jgi:hypothetical protein
VPEIYVIEGQLLGLKGFWAISPMSKTYHSLTQEVGRGGFQGVKRNKQNCISMRSPQIHSKYLEAPMVCRFIKLWETLDGFKLKLKEQFFPIREHDIVLRFEVLFLLLSLIRLG